ncbi:hypothetical protein [Jiangella muralis]|uniref:hypothetical protein n=1 Tax=Jiangella muralis TaxID=702383 RepID=UPI0012FC6C50|nr:hypothetical protein [Jiangella muralis]
MSVITALPLKRVTEIRVDRSNEDCLTFEPVEKMVRGSAKHLLIEISAAHTHTEPQCCEVILNGDRGAAYNVREFSGSGSNVATHAGLSRRFADGVDIPPQNRSRYGGGYLFFPNAFGEDNLKIFQAMGSSFEERLQRHVGLHDSTSIISSISLRPRQAGSSPNFWSVGSIMTLYAVDEDFLITRKTLAGSRDPSFRELPSETNHLAFVMHARALDGREGDQGARIYQAVNGSGTHNDFPMQRFGGENNKINKVLDGRFEEPRVGWSPNDFAPANSFGSLVAFYPEFQRSSFCQCWISQHAAWEETFFPVSQENGAWIHRQEVMEFQFYSQFRGGYASGSYIDAYRLPVSHSSRRIAGASGESSVTLEVPEHASCMRAFVVARTNANVEIDGLLIGFNGNLEGSNYVRRRMSAAKSSHETHVAAESDFGVLPGSNAPPEVFGCNVIAFPHHAAVDREKHVLSVGGTSTGMLALFGGRWNCTEAVTSVTFTPKIGTKFAEGSTFELSFAGT